MIRNILFPALVGTTVSLFACATEDEPQLDSVDQLSSVHLRGGRNAEPSFTDNGLTLTAVGDLAGLGNQNIEVTLSATGRVTATCTNRGGNQPPGQNPAPVSLAGVVSIPASEIRNGNVRFTVTTRAPANPIPGAPDCPNRNFNEIITDIQFTSATITVEQPPGTTALTVNCAFSSPTSNGAVPAGVVTCTSS